MNRQWDRGRKSRFRNDFERGVLHLYFDFKKYQINSSCSSFFQQTGQMTSDTQLLYINERTGLGELLPELSLEVGLFGIIANYR